MRVPKLSFLKCESGQALIETALVMPVLLAVVLNAVNLGFVFLVALNLAATPRASVEYGIMGWATPVATMTVPNAGPANSNTSVAYLGYEDLRGALAAYANAKIQVCTKRLGFTNAGTINQKAECETCTSSTDPDCSDTADTYTPLSDPESPAFVLHRVDVTYTFNSLFPGTFFNVALLPTTLCNAGTCTFHRQVSMRAMD